MKKQAGRPGRPRIHPPSARNKQSVPSPENLSFVIFFPAAVPFPGFQASALRSTPTNPERRHLFLSDDG